MFKIKENVIVKDYSVPGKVSWTKGIILEKIGKQTYFVKTECGKKWKRHANQIISCIKPGKNETEMPSTLLDTLQKISPSIQNNIQQIQADNITEQVNKNFETQVATQNTEKEIVKEIDNIGKEIVNENKIIEKEIVKYNLRERKNKIVNN